MELLFKRGQTSGTVAKVGFKLWGKVEFDDEEQRLVQRYGMDKAVLILQEETGLTMRSIGFGLVVAVVSALPLAGVATVLRLPEQVTVVLPVFMLIFGIIGGYWHYHRNRETIFVRDLMHGRNFICDSVVELAQKEAWLQTVTGYLRQVMETSKHWDGTERHTIEALPKEDARRVILQGI